MGNFQFKETKIKDLYIIEPKVFGDISWKVIAKKLLMKQA